MSIRTRLLILFLTLSIIPGLFIGALIFYNTKSYITGIALGNLRNIIETVEGELLEFLSAKAGRTVDFTTDGYIKAAVRSINGARDPILKRELGKKLGEYLEANKRPVDADLIEIHVLDPSGVVISSTDAGFIGVDESAQPYFQKGKEGPFIQDWHSHRHGTAEHKFIPVAAPIKAGGELIGVLMNGYSISLADDILSGKRSKALGSMESFALERIENLDIYIVGPGGYVLTPSKKIPDFRPLEKKALSFPVEQCLENSREVNAVWMDFTGQRVWGASACMGRAGWPRWVLVAEQGEEEALTPLVNLQYAALIAGGCALLVVGLTAWSLSLSISRPINALKKGAETVATGNLDYKIGSVSRDELGALSRAFDKMTEDLKKVTASRDELAREVEDRKRVLAALIRSEEKYRNLVDTALVGIYRSTIDGRIVFVNSALSEMLEFASPEELTAMGAKALYRVPDDRDAFIRLLIEQGRIDAFETELVTRTGKIKSVIITASLAGEILTGMVLDVTERKRAAEITREAAHARARAEISQAIANAAMDYKGLLETIARHIGDLVGKVCVIRLLSDDKKWLDVAAVYHRDPEALDDLKKFLAFNPQPSDRGVGAKVVATGRQLALESPEEIKETIRPEYWQLLERLGIERAIVSPLRTSGQTIGLIAVFRDKGSPPFSQEEAILIQDLADRAALAITNTRLYSEVRQELEKRRKAEEEIKTYAAELERSNAELQQFAYVTSHDLQEPLRMVASYMNLLEKRYKGAIDEKADTYIRFAVEGAERMQRMINALLEFSRVQTQARPFEPVNMDDALRQALDNLQVAIRESGAVIIREPLPVIKADPVQIMQVFQNLIGNAIKFRGGEPPRVQVSAVEEEGRCVFSVKDNGIGIDPKFKDRIFEIFQRLHGPEYPGTGIGLAVCKRIIERHGGDIWVDSEPGKGAEFYFTVPKGGG